MKELLSLRYFFEQCFFPDYLDQSEIIMYFVSNFILFKGAIFDAI